jgi:hypothetical protein
VTAGASSVDNHDQSIGQTLLIQILCHASTEVCDVASRSKYICNRVLCGSSQPYYLSVALKK